MEKNSGIDEVATPESPAIVRGEPLKALPSSVKQAMPKKRTNAGGNKNGQAEANTRERRRRKEQRAGLSRAMLSPQAIIQNQRLGLVAQCFHHEPMNTLQHAATLLMRLSRKMHVHSIEFIPRASQPAWPGPLFPPLCLHTGRGATPVRGGLPG